MALTENLLMTPITFGAASYVLRVTANAVTEDLTFPATGSLTEGRYYWIADDGAADASTNGGVGSLCTLLAATLNSHSQLSTTTVTLDAGFKVRINSGATLVQILWTHANTTLDSAYGFGFDVTSDTSTAGVLTSDYIPEGIWLPDVPYSEGDPDEPELVSGIVFPISGPGKGTTIAVGPDVRNLVWQWLDKSVVRNVYAAVDQPFLPFETHWKARLGRGDRFRLYDDRLTVASGTFGLYQLTDIREIPWVRKRVLFYDVSLRARRAED